MMMMMAINDDDDDVKFTTPLLSLLRWFSTSLLRASH